MPEQAVRKALAQGMHELNENMVTLAELSEYAIRRAVDSLARMDSKSAQEVFTIDREVYALQIEIEKRCGDLIALHAPVAGDLRLITTSLKITTDFDRIGRYSKDIAEITLQIQNGKDREFARLPGLPRMVDLTIEMVDRAMREEQSHAVERGLRDKVLTLLVKRGTIGLKKNQFLEILRGVIFEDLVQELNRLEGEGLLTLAWHGPSDFTAQITPKGVDAARKASAFEGE